MDRPESAKSDPMQEADNVNSKNRKNSFRTSGSVNKRRCVSTACIACRRRKSKCDGNVPKCAACASVYLTECEYAPHTDHRRKGVYKKDTDSLKTKSSTLQTIIQTLLTSDEEDAIEFLKQMRSSDNLEELVQNMESKSKGLENSQHESPSNQSDPPELARFDVELSARMGDLMLDGSVKFIGGTSNLVWLEDTRQTTTPVQGDSNIIVRPCEEAILGWTSVTKDKASILHFANMYFCWHYPYFPALSKELFYRDFLTGTNSQYCSSILVNAILALGCHYSSRPAARANLDDPFTIGDHFFAEAKQLLYDNEELANAKLCTVQALAIMSIREAGCGRETNGWVYSGMSFRMALDLGLNVDVPAMNDASRLSDEDIDARRLTYWGVFLIDKCWSNYLGRQPQLHRAYTSTKKFDVYPSEESELWSPYTDSGIINANSQPARTRAVALEIMKLAEISADLLTAFYQPNPDEKSTKQTELKKLTDIHTRLEAWKSELAAEFEPREGALPSVLLMHMFYQLLYIHLYRPFLRFNKNTSPLPPHVSPRKYCTQAAASISKLLRLYKRTHGLRQIINKVVYIAHSAATIHLLNLPDKNAKRDIVHTIKQLEEIGECWPTARRTLRILNICAQRWRIELPEEAQESLNRVLLKWGNFEPSHSAAAVSPQSTGPAALEQSKSRPSSDPMMQTLQQLQSQPRSHPKQESHTARQEDGSDYIIHNQPRNEDLRNMQDETTIIKSQAIPDMHQVQSDWANRRTNGHTVSTSVSEPLRSLPTMPAVNSNVFGAMDAMPVVHDQDWWYNDQKQFAAGFENWNAPESDWHNMNGMETTNGTPMPNLPAVGGNGLFTAQNKQYNQNMQTGALLHQPPNPNMNVSRYDQYHPQGQVSAQQAYAAYKQAHMHRQMSWGEQDLM